MVVLREEANTCPRNSREGHGSMWATAVRAGFEMEEGHLPWKVKRKELVQFSALHPSHPEHPSFLMRSSGLVSRCFGGECRHNPVTLGKLLRLWAAQGLEVRVRRKDTSLGKCTIQKAA